MRESVMILVFARYPNVLILTTSNVTGAIDLAFVDRADIKQYIGPPSAEAVFTIYKSCILELMRVTCNLFHTRLSCLQSPFQASIAGKLKIHYDK